MDVKVAIIDEATTNNDNENITQENNTDDHAVKVPWWTSCRLALGVVGFVGFLNLYALRINMSVGIVCMVNQTAVLEMSSRYTDPALIPNETVANTCPNTTTGLTPAMEGEFIWSKQLQGIILGSFFWGYILTQIPGGWLAGRYGGKRVFGYFMLGTAIATLLIPIGSRGSPYLLMVLRFITGIGQGVAFPAMSALWGKWAPPGERAILISLTYAGTQFGNVIALPLSGLLCDKGFAGGWPSIYYVGGIFGLVWFALWMFIAYDSPAEHPRISEIEKIYIETSIGATKKSPVLDIPWRKLFTSVPVWNLMFIHTCVTWGIYTLLTNIPTFMREVLKFDIKSNGLFSAIPYMAFGIVALTGGILSDKLLEKGMSVANTRRFCLALGCVVPGVFLVGTGYITCNNPYIGVTLLTIAMGFSGFQFPGFTTNCVDIAPPFAGIIFGIENTAATLSGILAPYVISVMTVDQTQQQWQGVFYLAAGLYIFGAIVYTIFVRGEVMDWVKPYMNEDETVDRIEKKYENGAGDLSKGAINLALKVYQHEDGDVKF